MLGNGSGVWSVSCDVFLGTDGFGNDVLGDIRRQIFERLDGFKEMYFDKVIEIDLE